MPSGTPVDRGDPALPTVRRWRGPAPGPTIALLGGVHGDEVEGVLAVNEIARLVAAEGVAGELRWVAPASPDAWAAATREHPVDGGNLARSFPGRSDGGPTEGIAAMLTADVIGGSDLVIDLHSAGSAYEMPLLCGYLAAGPLADRAAAAAASFAAEYTWRHPAIGPGRTLSAAEQLGVPAIYAECRGGGRTRRADVQAYVDGVARVLAARGMLRSASAPAPLRAPIGVRGDGNTDEGVYSPVGGLLVTEVEAGDVVAPGQPLARIVDDEGITLHTISAERDGVVMMLRRSLRVAAEQPVLIVAALAETR